MKKILPTILSLLLAVLPTLAVPVEAADPWVAGKEVSPDLVRQAAEIASKLSRYPVPAKLPRALIVESKALDMLLCPPQIDPKNTCHIYGAVDYRDPGTIYLSSDIPVERRAQVLIHESVHIMQIFAGNTPVTSCVGAASNELEAYSIGARYQAQTQHPEVGMNVPDLSCPPPDEK